MGAGQSNAVQGVAPFNPTVEIVEKAKYDPHFGQIKIVRDTKTRDLYILKEFVVNTNEEFERICNSIKSRIALKYPNVVNIIGYTTEEKSNFCSTHYKISIYIEVLEKTLQSELEQRQKANVHYSEHDLLFVADSLISGLAQFQDQKIAHEDIRPFNIFVENRAYKLSDPFLSADQNANALVLAITQSIKTNLAPELIPQVPKKQFEITADRNRADVYSLGITLLSLGTLKNSEEWYDFEKGTINQSQIEANLESLRPRYSRYTYELIRDMLTVDPVQRPVFSGLASNLAPYRVDIREGGALPFISTIPQGERVTRSALPQDNSYTPDDLELRIQAALERSAQTFKTVAGRDSYNPPRDVQVEQTYVAPTTTTTTYNYSYATPSTTDKVVEITTVKETETRSAVPQDYKEVTYTPTYSFGTVEPEKKAYETSYNYTTTAPVTDNYGGLSKSRVAEDSTANAGTTSYTTYNYSTTPITENYGGLSKSRVAEDSTATGALSNSRAAGDYTANAGTTSYTTYNYSTTPITDNYGGLSKSRVAEDSTANAGTTSYTTSYNVTSYEYQPKTEIKTEIPVSSYSYQVENTSTGLTGTGLAEPVYKYESSTLPVTSGTTGDNTYSYSYTTSYGTGNAGTGAEGTSYSYTTPYAGTTTTTTTYQYVSSTAQPAELNEIAALGNLTGDKVSVSYNAIGGEQNQA